MAYFDQRPQGFRVLFGAFVACVLFVGAIDTYNLGKSPTDENLFADPPSWTYIGNAVPAERFDDEMKKFSPDSIRVGDLPGVTEILARSNNAIKGMKLGGVYMGMTIVRIKGTELHVAVAGMPPLLVYRASTHEVE